MSSMRIAAWNSEWAPPRSRRGRAIAAHLEELGGDLICLTEGKADLLPRDGHVIDSDPDYGYPIEEGRRKVLLWSRTPWREVDRVGDPALPSGRFVSGIADTPIGPIRALGMCIPWSMAHVTSGRRDRSPWEDHLAYLGGLRQILAMSSREPAIVVAGDFNQRIPAQRGRPLPAWPSRSRSRSRHSTSRRQARSPGLMGRSSITSRSDPEFVQFGRQGGPRPWTGFVFQTMRALLSRHG